MKMSIVAIALALACFVSFVLAADQPVTMTTPMSEAGRMQLAKAIKEAISSNPSAVDPTVAAMSTEDLVGVLSSIGSTVLGAAADALTPAPADEAGVAFAAAPAS
ncbi:hypothetical protein PR001_g16145 [Phytophthora rubi]|uniref:RxLR effector protein n=2 Tax=Phytophthora rubi TaxID=129364 RepID=A0A6A3NXF3_9STRA|nr:hypothetical protein PR001_g16145 [Phytophthora rubi]KAE9046171.1 hypothetical protein PR002_g1831 [Phytophthora rubi]